MSKAKKKAPQSNTIAKNKKARHEFVLEDKFEAGIALQGWEVKSIRAGKVNISETFVTIQNGEAYLVGAQIQPLHEASTHVVADPVRSRKLLLKQRELEKLMAARDRQGYSLITTAMYWSKCWVKVEFFTGKGKKDHDKRSDMKDQDWARQKERMMKHTNR